MMTTDLSKFLLKMGHAEQEYLCIRISSDLTKPLRKVRAHLATLLMRKFLHLNLEIATRNGMGIIVIGMAIDDCKILYLIMISILIMKGKFELK